MYSLSTMLSQRSSLDVHRQASSKPSRVGRSRLLILAKAKPPLQRDHDTIDAVVVGGGWAGLGAAYALAKAGTRSIQVVDAAPTPGGLAATSVVNGREVEPGIKGFWADYVNIFQLVRELGLQDPFTPWTRSSFYSPKGLQVSAPIFGNQPRLPTPLGSFLYTLPEFKQLPLADRATAVALVPHLLRYHQSQETYRQYDEMSAQDLFVSAGVSRRLLADFLDPILQVVLFAPAASLSAAASLDALYFFALAHQQSFDIRWCRGPVGGRLLQPLAARLREMGVQLQQRRRLCCVESVAGTPGSSYRLTVTGEKGGPAQHLTARTVVLALGVGAMSQVVDASPLLHGCPTFKAFKNLGGLDVIAARLWLDRRITPATPSNVIVGFEPGVGGTFFDLNALQDEYQEELNSVVEVDLYGAGPLMSLTDDALIQRLLRVHLRAADPAYAAAVPIDACVRRFGRAVTSFAPGSAAHMPPTATPLPGVFMAGDWVKQGPGSHPAKGLCQEKAVATGYMAGNAAAAFLGRTPKQVVLDPEPEEQHVVAGRQVVATLDSMQRLLPFGGLPFG